MASLEIQNTAELAARRDAALRRALNRPPQPKHGKVKESNQAKPNRSGASKPRKRERPAEAS